MFPEQIPEPMTKLNWRRIIKGVEVGTMILILAIAVFLLKIALNQNLSQSNPSEWCESLENPFQGHLCKEVAGDTLKFRFFREIIKNESSWNPKAVGDSGRAKSLAQFHKPTFEEFMKESGMTNLEYENGFDQITLMVWAFDNDKENHWTTYRSLIKKREWKEIAKVI
jgi:hypothetical protein